MKGREINQRQFARLFALGGSGAILRKESLFAAIPSETPNYIKPNGAVDWDAIRSEFLIPPELTALNAANQRGDDWAGVRFSPHFYNSRDDVRRMVSAIRRYVRKGL